MGETAPYSMFSRLIGKGSFGLNYPEVMSGVKKDVINILNSKGFVVDTDPVTTVAEAKELVKNSRQGDNTYYMVESDNRRVWDVLSNPISRNEVFVLGIFHGNISPDIRKTLRVFDIGQAIQSKVSKPIVDTLTYSLQNKGKFPKGDTEKLFQGLKVLCYEIVYDSEKSVFPKSLRRHVYVSTAFKFLYSEPSSPTPASMATAVDKFVRTAHGNLG